METNSTAPTISTNLGQVTRVLTTALCAAAFVVMLAFGGPDADSSRWDADVDAHSDLTFEIALNTDVAPGE